MPRSQQKRKWYTTKDHHTGGSQRRASTSHLVLQPLYYPLPVKSPPCSGLQQTISFHINPSIQYLLIYTMCHDICTSLPLHLIILIIHRIVRNVCTCTWIHFVLSILFQSSSLDYCDTRFATQQSLSSTACHFSEPIERVSKTLSSSQVLCPQHKGEFLSYGMTCVGHITSLFWGDVLAGGNDWGRFHMVLEFSLTRDWCWGFTNVLPIHKRPLAAKVYCVYMWAGEYQSHMNWNSLMSQNYVPAVSQSGGIHRAFLSCSLTSIFDDIISVWFAASKLCMNVLKWTHLRSEAIPCKLE